MTEEEKKQQERDTVSALASQLVSDIGNQLTAAGYPPPVLWYALSCAARVAELGLEHVVEQEPSAAAALDAARARLPELLAHVEAMAKDGKAKRH